MEQLADQSIITLQSVNTSPFIPCSVGDMTSQPQYESKIQDLRSQLSDSKYAHERELQQFFSEERNGY